MLTARRGSGNVIPLKIAAEKQLHFMPDELSYFVPVRDPAGQVTGPNCFEGGDDGPSKLLPRN
jgi:D-alanyl-D-alanine carboxypeptidase